MNNEARRGNEGWGIFVSRLGRASPKRLQVTAGLSNHVLGLQRCCLSVMEAIYQFSSDGNRDVVEFDAFLRDGLLVTASLVLVARAGSKTNPRPTQGSASRPGICWRGMRKGISLVP